MRSLLGLAMVALIGCEAAPPASQRLAAKAATMVLLVDRDHATSVEDGTAAHPFATIGRAVAVAAADASDAAYLISVAPGSYSDEALPIQLARRSVAIAGATRFVDDGDGRPIGIVDGTQTGIAVNHIRDRQPFFYVTAARVSISGLMLTQARTYAIVADGAADFDFSGNDVENAARFGIVVMHGASGRIAHSLLANQFGAIVGSGGDGTPRIVVDRNHSHHNKPIGSIFTGSWDHATVVDLSPAGAPLLTTVVDHPAPTSIDVVETNNAFRHNECVGTRMMAFSPDALTGDAATMAATTSLTARIDGNLFEDNHCVGVAVDGGNGLAIAGVVYNAQMTVTATHNLFSGNKYGAQVVSVGHFGLPYEGITTFNAGFQELRHSQLGFVTDGPVDYWNPPHDVFACAQALDDTVTVNRAPVIGTNVDASLLCPADR